MPKRNCQIINMSDAQVVRAKSQALLGAEGLYWFCLEKWHPKRTLAQNAFWWAVVVPRLTMCLQEGYGDNSWDDDSAHLWAKMLWLPVQERKLPDGTTIKLPVSTTKLDLAEFATLIDNATAWLGALGVSVPDSSEYCKKLPKSDVPA